MGELSPGPGQLRPCPGNGLPVQRDYPQPAPSPGKQDHDPDREEPARLGVRPDAQPHGPVIDPGHPHMGIEPGANPALLLQQPADALRQAVRIWSAMRPSCSSLPQEQTSASRHEASTSIRCNGLVDTPRKVANDLSRAAGRERPECPSGAQ